MYRQKKGTPRARKGERQRDRERERERERTGMSYCTIHVSTYGISQRWRERGYHRRRI